MIELSQRRGLEVDFHKFRFAEMGIPHDQKLHDETMAIIREVEEGRISKLRRAISSLLHRDKPPQNVVKISEIGKIKVA